MSPHARATKKRVAVGRTTSANGREAPIEITRSSWRCRRVAVRGRRRIGELADDLVEFRRRDRIGTRRIAGLSLGIDSDGLAPSNTSDLKLRTVLIPEPTLKKPGRLRAPDSAA